MAQKLLVYQSLWAMERRRPDGQEWSLAEKLAMIRDAGFDGCGVRFIDPAYRARGHRLPARPRHDLAGAMLSAEAWTT